MCACVHACMRMTVLYYSVNIYICTELKNFITFWQWYSTYYLTWVLSLCTFGNEIFLEKYLFILFIIYDGGSCQGKWPGVIKVLKYCNSKGKLFKLNQSLLFVRALKLCHFVKLKGSKIHNLCPLPKFTAAKCCSMLTTIYMFRVFLHTYQTTESSFSII